MANTSSDAACSQSNGDGVYRRTLCRSSILGFGRPDCKAASIVDKVKEASATAKETVPLARVIDAANTDPSKPQGHASHPADTKLVEAALQRAFFPGPT